MGYEKIPTSPSSSTNDSRGTSEETARPEEEHLMGYQKYGSSSKRQQSRLLGSCWWLLTVAILLILNIMTLVLLFQSVRRVRSLETPPPKSWLPPEVGIKKVFLYDEEYGQVPSEESNEAWYNLMPNGLGFVKVNNDTAIPDTPGLNQSLPIQRATTGAVHQIHCLIVIRAAYYGAMAGNIDAIDPAHLPHCFDYLRQSIMCASDTTMEWVPAPPNDKGSTGWGYQHSCRDYMAIRQWAIDNKWGTSTGIW
ncbi:hypothetical protein MMC28_008025 [Mycoblastus sanguinarius]|nr:hypothetical protein [Mycoblastus sanguinarius]